jgi:predicted RNA-binding Zn-ribbon protein involved in translation (DUF1610 family)
MTQGPSERIATSCTHCGKTYTMDASHAGRAARCRACGEVFTIVPVGTAAPAAARPPAARPAMSAGHAAPPGRPPSPGAPPGAGQRAAQAAPAQAASAPDRAAPAERLCAICQTSLAGDEERVQCPDCHTAYHRSCWDYNQGCGMYGCPKSPATEKLEPLEIPTSYWGNENKACPSCGGVILAAAVRCRHCGATFQSAAPTSASSFHQDRQIEGRLPGLRKAAIWLLVFCAISCTAPIAGLIALFWYIQNRAAIAKLPPLWSALCKLTVGIGLGQTVLMIVAALLYAATS